MNKRQYTTLTSEGKQHLFKSQNTIPKPTEPARSQKQNKFLEHFKSINNVDPIINLYARSTSHNEDHQALYMTKLQSYAESKISHIERIIRSNDDDGHIKTVRIDFKISPAPPLIHVKPEIKRNVQKINDFFNFQDPKLSIDQKKQQQELFHTEILQIAAYSQILQSLPSRLKQQPKPQLPNFYSIYNTPTQRPIYEYNNFQSPSMKMPTKNMADTTQRYMHSTPDRFGPIQINQINPKQSEMPNLIQPEIKFRKADMLLVEILRERKRKGLVSDYYKIMELKLFELLDFILQDQPEFQGLSSIEKMKQVLKKLEYFKGKKIEGQNKINLLKIFFQEFRNLKNEISESEKKKPLQKVQNKPKLLVQRQTPIKQSKQVDKKGVHNRVNKLPYKDRVSINGDKKQKGQASQGSKSVKGMQDEWMGDLQ